MEFFVIHEFSTQMREDFRNVLRKAFKGSGFEGSYADGSVGQRHILSKIAEMIERSAFIICEISNPNKPNIFLELGYAISCAKRCYIICRAGTPIPSDLAGMDRIEYESFEGLAGVIRDKIVPQEKAFVKKMIAIRSETMKGDDVDEEQLKAVAVDTYVAADMLHKFGIEEFDDAASTGRAWRADLSVLSNHIVFGPYKSLPSSGAYRVYFRLKMSYNSLVPRPALRLDVFGAFPGAIAIRDVFAAEFKEIKKYQLFALDFEYDGTCALEYRVFNIAQMGTVWTDYIAIIRLKS